MLKQVFLYCILLFALPVMTSEAETIDEAMKQTGTDIGKINSQILMILQKYMFDGNDSITRRDLSVEINNYLNGIEKLTNYDVVSDISNNPPDVVFSEIVRVDVFLVFNNSNKPISLNYEVGSSGVYETTLLNK